MLAPLPAGAHEIRFGGTSSSPDGDFTVDVTYQLTVQ